MDRAVERAIRYMWERHSEPLSLAQIACSAQLSRFYFARQFRITTGITPGRFLAAIRIHQAKQLLLDTSLSINDISCAVGYNSLGSFSNYFTCSVGISPGQFRRLSRSGALTMPMPWSGTQVPTGSVAGTISLPGGYGTARVFVGAFPTAIVQQQPAAAVIVDVPTGRPCCYRLRDIPAGMWSLHAVALADGLGRDATVDRSWLIGRHDGVEIAAGSVTSAALRLRRGLITDPPVLLALPDLVPPIGPAGIGCAATAHRAATIA